MTTPYASRACPAVTLPLRQSHHSLRVTLEGLAVASASGRDVTKHVALLQARVYLRGQHLFPVAGVKQVHRPPARFPALQSVGWKARRSDLQVIVASGASTSHSRVRASPPRCRPGPPESGTYP